MTDEYLLAGDTIQANSVWPGRITSLLAGLLLVGAAAAFMVPDGHTLSGEVDYVLDGDTINLGNKRVRLWGVDAPERYQTCGDARGGTWLCGERAQIMLRHMLREEGTDYQVRCEVKDHDRPMDQYRRTVALCRTPDGRDLGARLVAMGLAVDVPRYSGGYYRDEEAAARSERLGMWQGDFTRPDIYRHSQR